MSSTYTWQNALTAVAPYCKSIPTTTVDLVVCDQLNSFIWKFYPWRWAQATLTSASGLLNLVDGVQDYSIGTTTGGGYYQLLRVRLTRTDTTPDVVREKNIVNWLAPNLETSGGMDSIQAICFEPTIQSGVGGLRLDRAASVPSGVTMRVDGEYWFQPVKITSTTSVIVFPDQHFSCATEGLKWKYYQLGDDSRAGDMVYDRASKTWRATGQAAVFLAEVEKMATDEDYGDGPGSRFPEESLGVGKGSSGLYGWP